MRLPLLFNRKTLVTAYLCLCFFCAPFCCGTALCAGTEDLEESIAAKEREVSREQQDLKRLTEEERKLFGDMAAIEKRIRAQERTLEEQLTRLEAVTAEMQEIDSRFGQLKEEQIRGREELRAILTQLWPVHISNVFGSQLQGLETWSKADRHFKWYSAIYEAVDKRVALLKQKELELAATLAARETTQQRIQEQTTRIAAVKEDLLAERLTFLEQVRSIRAMRLAKEEQLSHIRSTIKDLQYQLKVLTTHQFDKLKGYLPWPAKGRPVMGFNLKASPPQRGIGLALPDGSEVQAVSWGKVVHNDQMRGFGQVVILYHGDDYYSLYAFLAETELRVGQDVEKGETIGMAGFYPAAGGSGLYFELRFGPKPINPRAWLVALN